MLLFSDMCLRCPMLTLSGHVEFFFFFGVLPLGEWLSVVCVFPIYVPVYVVCFMFDCVGELFVECV